MTVTLPVRAAAAEPTPPEASAAEGLLDPVAHTAGRGQDGAGRSRPPAAPPIPLNFPTDADVSRLARVSNPLSVSVLMATTPAERMTVGDRARLEALVRQAHRRLLVEPDRRGVDQVRAGLEQALASAVAGGADRGVALLASPAGTHVFHLRIGPVDRVVLDPTYATRDLVRSAAEDPAFLLLVIDGRAARALPLRPAVRPTGPRPRLPGGAPRARPAWQGGGGCDPPRSTGGW